MGQISKQAEIENAKAVLRQEIFGLTALIDSIGNDFVSVVDLLSRKNGHVILSGMGKPGHICAKIAATMASTGTPAFFLHPAEACHGDLGMISDDDTLLVFSWSGNTQELIPMLEYANRFGIDVIGITSNPESVLAKSSKIKLILPQADEATPEKLAPTTSTTMMIALGDAIAVCLLKRKEFNRDAFKKLHPGGSLGKKLLIVKDLMHEDVPIVRETDLMQSVLDEMTRKKFGCTCVVNKLNKIVGVITDGDLRRSICNNFLEKTASEIMSKNPRVVSEDLFAQEATKMMNDNKITSLFVSENEGTPIGIIHIHDCLRAGLV